MSYDKHLANLIMVCLRCEKRDSIAILHDSYFEPIARMIYEYCRKNSIKANATQIQYEPSQDLPSNAKQIFLSDSNNVIILGFLQNVWHIPERKIAKYQLGKRLVNLLYAGKPCRSYCTNYHDIIKRSVCLKNILDDHIGKVVQIMTKNGTDLTAGIGKTFCEDGNYTVDGSGGDFPAGEVGFSPIPGSVNGKLVYDVKIQHIGNVKKKQLIVTVKKDKVIKVVGMYNDEFLKLISMHPVLKYVSEISIGTNPVLCSVSDKNSIIEEKNLGTVHIGNGGNKSYGEREGPHFDGVMAQPTIVLENLVLMHTGNPIAF